jgi:predicted MarR family transcription regulator
MRKVYLNTAAAKYALSILTKGELLEQLSEPTEGIFEFKTTEKGKAALAQYYQLITYFFETKQKRRSQQYMILPLLIHLSRLVFGQISLIQEHSQLQVGHSSLPREPIFLVC